MFSFSRFIQNLLAAVVKLTGTSVTVGLQSFRVKEVDGDGNIIRATGTVIPADGVAGWAKDAEVIKTNAATGVSGRYVNVGTTSSSVWSQVNASNAQDTYGAIITATGTTDVAFTVPYAGVVTGISIVPGTSLSTSDTNYITVSATNVATGSGTAALLATSDANTTKATGGSALTANTARALTLTGTAADLVVAKGDRIRVRAVATGTLASAIAATQYRITIAAS